MAVLSNKKRNGLRSSTFAVPGRRAFPIPDKPHAHAALSLIRYAHSPAEKTAIRNKAHAMLSRAYGGMVDAPGIQVTSPLPQNRVGKGLRRGR